MTSIQLVGAFSRHSGPEEEHILLRRDMHLCLRCSVHSSLTMKVPVILQKFLSEYHKSEARLPQETQGICLCFLRCVNKGDVFLRKFGTNILNTFHNPKHDCSSVTVPIMSFLK